MKSLTVTAKINVKMVGKSIIARATVSDGKHKKRPEKRKKFR